MIGKGFLIYQLQYLPAVGELIALLRWLGARWLSIKIADGVGFYNQIGGNDKILRDEYIANLQADGFRVGGWHYVYGVSPGPEAGRAAERIQKLGLDFYQIDAEREWKVTGAKKKAETFIKSLSSEVNKAYPVDLCSYRFPTWHPEFPWGGFLNNDVVKSVSPQVYWQESHNPAEQLERSEREYAALTGKPFYPIGSTYSTGKQGSQSYWEPSIEDIREFGQAAAWYPGYSYYTLDWMLRKARKDWLEAIAGQSEPPPIDPPAFDPIVPLRLATTTANLNVRAGPGTQYADIGTLRMGSEVPVVAEWGDWVELRGCVHKDWLK